MVYAHKRAGKELFISWGLPCGVGTALPPAERVCKRRQAGKGEERYIFLTNSSNKGDAEVIIGSPTTRRKRTI